MKKNVRNIEVTAALDVDVYIGFKEECAAINESMSKVFFLFAKSWTEEQKNSRKNIGSEPPKCGHNTPRFFASRASSNINYGAAHKMRRNL